MPPIINAQGISKAFGASPLFQNVSFTISEGDRIGLIGPNGSGKSTLLRIFAGSLDPDEWELPPKPKWMRWKTYNRHVQRFHQYEAELEYGCALLARISHTAD